MGLDAQLYFTTTRKVSKEELADLNYRFKEAVSFGWGDFPIEEKNFTRNGLPYYEVCSLSRYYGEGYERGDFPEIYMTFQWIKGNFENAVIYYGGDTYDDKDSFETPILDEYEEESLIEHWVKNGGLPYRHREPENPALRKECPKHLGKIMDQYMWGGNAAGIICQACKHKEETHDGGKTWEEIK